MTIPCSYHHCGVTASGSVVREGHCPCPECHDLGPGDMTPASRIIRTDIPDQPVLSGRSTPMCARWYERAGNYRPWHSRETGCMCAVPAHALPEQHGRHCPVYQYQRNHPAGAGS